MAKITVKDTTIRTLKIEGDDYISLTDIARQKNPVEPKDVIKNWMRSKNTLEYLGLWEGLNNPVFKGVEFDLKDAGSNAFTMSPSRWIELTNAKGIVSKSGANGGTYAQHDIAFKFASLVSVEFELYLITVNLLGIEVPNKIAKTYYAIKQNPNATNNNLSETLGISDRSVREHISELKRLGLIERSGSKKNGYWEIK